MVMLPKLSYKNLFSTVVLIGIFLIVTISCERKERYIGLYRAQEGELQKPSEIYIELKENGQGVWRVNDDEVSFNWNFNKNELSLHIKTGGIIIGKISDDTLAISLPGSKVRYFKKTR